MKKVTGSKAMRFQSVAQVCKAKIDKLREYNNIVFNQTFGLLEMPFKMFHYSTKTEWFTAPHRNTRFHLQYTV